MLLQNMKCNLRGVIVSVLVLLLGPALAVAYILRVSYLEKNYSLYSNLGEIHKDLDLMFDDTDASLVWMLRSEEYDQASEDGKYNMRRSWAEQYTDREIGRFSRILVVGVPLLLSAITLVMALSSIAGCD